MILINNFDIYSDFYSDPQLKAVFAEEYEAKVSSNLMWALMLYAHPKSKYYAQDDQTKRKLIQADYLKAPLNIEAASPILEKIDKFLLTKTDRLLKGWETKLEERDEFMHSRPYDESNYEMLDKMLAASAKMWDSYLTVRKKAVDEESTTHARGDIELSLSERGVI